jgi:hypothetical protein
VPLAALRQIHTKCRPQAGNRSAPATLFAGNQYNRSSFFSTAYQVKLNKNIPLQGPFFPNIFERNTHTHHQNKQLSLLQA